MAMDQREIGAPGVSVGPVDSAGERRSGIVGRADMWLERFGSTILTALFLVMSALGFIQVVCRYFLEYPLYWSEELIRYLFVWTTFLGAGVATAQGLHIEIDILSTIVAKKPPERKEKILRTIRIFSTSLMLIFLAYYAYLTSDFLGKINTLKQFSTAMEVNMLWPMSAVLVGALLMLLHYLTRFIRDLKANSFVDARDLKERREG